jgi:isocitrate dehydrogenase
VLPYVDIKLKEFDLSIYNRNETDDKVTLDALEALKRVKAGVKCATITATNEKLKEF